MWRILREVLKPGLEKVDSYSSGVCIPLDKTQSHGCHYLKKIGNTVQLCAEEEKEDTGVIRHIRLTARRMK